MIEHKTKQQIIHFLMENIPSMKCPMCNQSVFTIIDGYFAENIQDDYKNLIIGAGKIIPSIVLVCNKCGFMSRHSIGVLGFLKDD